LTAEPLPSPTPKPLSRWLSREIIYGLLAVLLIAVVGWFYVHVVDTETLGFTHDDGVYAIAGKSLAEGKGFKLLHVIGQPGEIKYPFVYPAILALVWLVNPHFPQNLPALNYITIAFTLGACGLIYLYLRKAQKFPGWLALLVIAMTTAHFFFIYFFSSIMSEGPFLFFTMLTLLAAHWATRNGPNVKPNHLWLLVILSAITFLTRIPGVALMGATGVWFLINGQWKNALRYGAGCLALGIMPWALWVKFQTPVVTELNYPLVNAYSNYGLEFLHNFTGTNYLASLPADFRSLFTSMLEQLFPIIPNFLKRYPQFSKTDLNIEIMAAVILISQYLVSGYFLLQAIHTVKLAWAKGSGWFRGRLNPEAFSIPGLYLFFYIVMITFWNYEDQLSRFLTAVSPLLWLYFFKPWLAYIPEFGQAWPAKRKLGAVALVGALLTTTLSVWIAPSSYKTVSVSRNQHWIDSGKYRWMWGEYKQVFAWINTSLPQDAPFAVASDVVFYLYTGHPTFYTFFASLRRKNGKFTPESIPLLMKSLDAYHVQYLVAEPHMTARVIRKPVNEVAKNLLRAFPQRFKLVYVSPRDVIRIYKIVPDATAATQSAQPGLITGSSRVKAAQPGIPAGASLP